MQFSIPAAIVLAAQALLPTWPSEQANVGHQTSPRTQIAVRVVASDSPVATWTANEGELSADEALLLVPGYALAAMRLDLMWANVDGAEIRPQAGWELPSDMLSGSWTAACCERSRSSITTSAVFAEELRYTHLQMTVQFRGYVTPADAYELQIELRSRSLWTNAFRLPSSVWIAGPTRVTGRNGYELAFAPGDLTGRIR